MEQSKPACRKVRLSNESENVVITRFGFVFAFLPFKDVCNDLKTRTERSALAVKVRRTRRCGDGAVVWSLAVLQRFCFTPRRPNPVPLSSQPRLNPRAESLMLSELGVGGNGGEEVGVYLHRVGTLE